MLNFEKNPIVYVTRDIERALGLSLDTKFYFVVSNYSTYAYKISKNKENVLLIKEKKILNTYELLKHKKTIQFINKKKASVLVFKNSKLIEIICARNKWKLLNPEAKLADKIESKISQLNFFKKYKKYFPLFKISTCKEIKWENRKFILQFNHSHSGQGTILIDNKKVLDNIKNKFPKRQVRLMEYIKGDTFTNNNIVCKNKIIIGNISYQITGLKPFTNLRFATIGNDWSFAKKNLNKKQIAEYKKIVNDIGLFLQKKGWKGAFGVDISFDEKTNKAYLIEVNARQPASMSLESILQKNKNKKGLSVFEAHLFAFLGKECKNKIITGIDGSQIVWKNNNFLKHNLYKKLEKFCFNKIEYKNQKDNSDFLRMQFKKSIIKIL